MNRAKRLDDEMENLSMSQRTKKGRVKEERESEVGGMTKGKEI